MGAEGKKIRLDWHVPEDLPTKAVSNVVITHTEEGEFFITYFEVVPPVLLGDSERFEAIDSVRAKAVARIMVVADRMPGMIKALQDNYDTWRRRREAVAEEVQE